MVESKNKFDNSIKMLFYFIIILLVIAALFPILHIVAKAFTSPDQIADLSVFAIWPKGGVSLDNFKVILQNPSFVRSLLNSMLIVPLGVFLSVLFTSFAAYALTREQLVFKNFFMILTIIVMIFDPGIVPEYLVMKDIGLIDSWWSVILFKLVNVYFLIILMRFFKNVPKELIETANIEGANHWNVYTRIMIPLSKAAIAAQTLWYFVYRWNEYFRASVYLNDPNKWPLQVLLRQFVVLEDNTALVGVHGITDAYGVVSFEALQSAAIVVGMLPILLLFPIILKYFTKGALDGSVKG